METKEKLVYFFYLERRSYLEQKQIEKLPCPRLCEHKTGSINNEIKKFVEKFRNNGLEPYKVDLFKKSGINHEYVRTIPII